MKKVFGIIVLVILVVLGVLFLGKGNAPEEIVVPVEDPGQLEGSFDLASSSVQYTGYGVGKEHVGNFFITEESTIEVGDEGELISGELIFDMTSLTAEGSVLLNHLKSSDFFDVENYPTASYTIEEIIPTPLDPNNDLIINGDLTIKDQTHPHNVVARYDATTGLLQMTTRIDRTKWDINFNSSKIGEFGDSLIRDEVKIQAVIDID